MGGISQLVCDQNFDYRFVTRSHHFLSGGEGDVQLAFDIEIHMGLVQLPLFHHANGDSHVWEVTVVGFKTQPAAFFSEAYQAMFQNGLTLKGHQGKIRCGAVDYIQRDCFALVELGLVRQYAQA